MQIAYCLLPDVALDLVFQKHWKYPDEAQVHNEL